MSEMNPIISWGLNALKNNDYQLPDDPDIRLSFQLAGLPKEEIDNQELPIAKHLLQSIFSVIRLGGVDMDIKNQWHQLQILNPDKMPIPQSNTANNSESYFENIKDELKKIDATQDEMIILGYIEKYGSYVSVSEQKPFLSLYDTIKNASAIYACLKRQESIKKFRMIIGDLSGIQYYLFNMSESNSKGVAKILRARSFYLSLFCDICRHYLLHTFELPLYCSLVEAGGRFVVLVPDDEDTLKKVEFLQNEIDQFCLKQFYGELALHFAVSPGFTENNFDENSLVNTFEILNHELDNKKTESFKASLKDECWQPEKFILDHDYDDYMTGLCEISGKLPKGGKNIFSNEFANHINLGKELVRKSYLTFSKGEPDKSKKDFCISFQFNSAGYYVHFLDTINRDSQNKYYLIENLLGRLELDSKPRYFDNYVPKFKNVRVDADCYYPFEQMPDFSIPLKDSDLQEKPVAGNIIDFSTISMSGIQKHENNQNNKDVYLGSKLLGLLKADVDCMGRLFSSGLKNNFSLSSYTTLSRQFNLFFAGYLPKIQEKHYPYIYTIYTGGDDLLFMGEWQQSILFSKEMYQLFREFTGWHQNITLSSAVYVMHHRHPIRTAAEAGEALLEKAKANTRDSFAIFDTVIKQKKLMTLMEYAAFLDEKRKLPDSESKINSGFLHRLNQYMKMAKAYTEGKDNNGIMYMPRLSYDMGRNIIKRNKKTNEIDFGQEEFEKLQALTDLNFVREHGFLQLPLYWAILKNRKLKQK